MVHVLPTMITLQKLQNISYPKHTTNTKTYTKATSYILLNQKVFVVTNAIIVTS